MAHKEHSRQNSEADGRTVMINIENITKRFGAELVLKGVSLQVKKGEVICIIGPSGSGKTTLLRSINFLEAADSGSISIDGVTVNCEKKHHKSISKLREKTSMVFQSYNLFNNKNAIENIMEGLIYARKMPKKQAAEVGRHYLEKVGLLHKQHQYPQSLSGGQKQRVGIARALALNPAVLLLDEPTSALDPEKVWEILELIKGIAQEGQTMIIVTHEMNFARQIASRVVFMEDGGIVEQGTPEKIFLTPENVRTQAFLKRIQFYA